MTIATVRLYVSALLTIAAFLVLFTVTAYPAETGLASYYDMPQALACGGRLDTSAMTAAHRRLPCGTMVRVHGPDGSSVVVKIVDRGPFIAGRIIDLTPAAFRELAPLRQGRVKVRLEIIGGGQAAGSGTVWR